MEEGRLFLAGDPFRFYVNHLSLKNLAFEFQWGQFPLTLPFEAAAGHLQCTTR
jgi:hypothetical protein